MQLCFVGDLHTQVGKRPAMQLRSLRLTEPYPFADVGQAFQTDPAPGAVALRASGLFYNCLADTVVDIIHKPTLPTRTFLQQSFRRFGRTFGSPFLLELLAQLQIAMAYLVDVRSREPFTIICRSNQVNAHVVADIFFGGFINVTGGKDVELASDKGQIALTLLVLQQLKLTFACLKRDDPPTREHPDTHFLGVQSELEDTTIEGE